MDNNNKLKNNWTCYTCSDFGLHDFTAPFCPELTIILLRTILMYVALTKLGAFLRLYRIHFLQRLFSMVRAFIPQEY